VRDGISPAHGRHRVDHQQQPPSDQQRPHPVNKRRSNGKRLAGLGVAVTLLVSAAFVANSAQGETLQAQGETLQAQGETLQAERLLATSDAYVSSASPTQQHGWSPRLVVKMNQARSLVRYNVPEAPSGYERRATLVLTRLKTSKPSTLRVSKTGGGWTEGVTYTTAPPVGEAVTSVADNGASPTARFDVSRAVTRSGELNLVVTQTSGGSSAIFGSRQSGSRQTVLEISYVPTGTPLTSPTVSPTTSPTSSPTSSPTTSPRPTSTVTTSSPTPSPTTTSASPSPTTTASSPTTSPAPTQTPTTTSLAPSWDSSGAYRLTFRDEFNDTAVDTTKWERGWFKEGISDGVNTNNLQCYDTRQVTESGGFLSLTLAQREAFCRGSNKQYVSGLVNTRNTFNQRYGSYEARVCLPDGNGDGRVDGFPAWWTNGPSSVPWPEHGEIDIVEGIGGGTKASLHYANPEYHGGVYSSAPLAGCHNFGSKWTSSGVTFYYDGKPLWSRAFNGPDPQFLILNYAIRPHSGEAIIPGTSVRVDWVRVWA
jgi:hypothetical protein